MKKRVLFAALFVIILSCTDNKVLKNINVVENIPYSNPPQIDQFKNPSLLKKRLIESSSLTFFDWRKTKFVNGSEKWYANSNVESFGKISKNGFQNDIVYITLGQEESAVNELQIVLNIKNPNDSKEALNTLWLWVEQTLLKLGIDIPENIKQNIVSEKLFFFENDMGYFLLKKEKKSEQNYNIHPEKELKSKITFDQWKFVIKSK